MLNLLCDDWLPVVREEGTRTVIRPSQVSETVNPVVSIDWPRADHRIATLELLVGLLATACPPEGGDAWLDWWERAPTVADLDRAFEPLIGAFNLDGDGPRFMQAPVDLETEPQLIERLLMESAGDITVQKNSDLIVHRSRIAQIGRPAAAISLYTLQSWAPVGGAGYRVGLRGGGPLVTLVLPGSRATLWQTLWANVPTGGQAPTTTDLPSVFPWMADPCAKMLTPADMHPSHVWWGLPRRIRLVCRDAPLRCDLTGSPDTVTVDGWQQRPGTAYVGWGRRHPLTPYYQQRPGGEWLAHHQHGDVGYSQWLGLVLATPDGLRLPAATVSQWHDGRGLDAGVRHPRLMAAGFDMDQMTAVTFLEASLPLPGAANAAEQKRIDDLSRDLVLSAGQVVSLLRKALRDAGCATPGSANRLWNETQTAFFSALESDLARADWLTLLRRGAIALFDELAPIEPDTGSSAAARIAKARKFLGIALAGYGAAGATLFTTLRLPAVDTKKKRVPRSRG